jgi:hypothetical protein
MTKCSPMNQRNYLAAYLLVVFGIVLLSNRVESAQLINDRVITVQSDREIAVKRRALIQYLWGKEEFPRRLPIGSRTSPAR